MSIMKEMKSMKFLSDAILEQEFEDDSSLKVNQLLETMKGNIENIENTIEELECKSGKNKELNKKLDDMDYHLIGVRLAIKRFGYIYKNK